MQLQLSCELGHGHGQPIVPDVQTEASEEQQHGGHEAEEAETGTSGALDEKNNEKSDGDQIGNATNTTMTGDLEAVQDCMP